MLLLSFSVWLACTLSFILALPSLGSSVAFSAATSIATIGLYISYGARAASLPLSLPPHCTVIDARKRRDTDRAARDLRGPLRPRTFPSRPVLAPSRERRRALDRVHIDRVLSPRAQPRQFTNAELCACRCRHRRHVLARLVVHLGAQVVHGAYQADHPR